MKRRRRQRGELLTQHLANEVAQEIMQEDGGASARVGKHTVNGQERYVVHVTYGDNSSPAQTVSRY